MLGEVHISYISKALNESLSLLSFEADALQHLFRPLGDVIDLILHIFR